MITVSQEDAVAPDATTIAVRRAVVLVEHRNPPMLLIRGAGTAGWDSTASSTEQERFNVRYRRQGTPDKNDTFWKGWRREQAAAFLRRLSVYTRMRRPETKFSAEVDPGNEEDARAWLKEGIVDSATLSTAGSPPIRLLDSAVPATNTGILCGTVLVGDNLAPADAATVEIRPVQKGATPLYRVTDGGGLYAALRLPPGDYQVTVTFNGEAAVPQRISVVAGETALADVLLSAGNLPEPRAVTGISSEKQGASVLLQSRRVTSIGSGFCGIADGPDSPVVRVLLPERTTVVVGERVTLIGTVRRNQGRPEIVARAVRLVGLVPIELPVESLTH